MESINSYEKIHRNVLWKRGALEQRCSENSGQNPWKILLREFTVKVTCDTAFLKINSLTSIIEEV